MHTLRDLMNLSGRAALVTGGAGHIGGEVAGALAELGAAVAVLDLDRAASDQVAARLQATYRARALGIACDLADEQAARDAIRQVTRHLGGLDILVHCAAYVGTTARPGWAVPFPEQTVAAFEAALRVNLTAAFTLVQEAHEALQRSGRGSVVLIGSIYGLAGPDHRLYEGTAMANPAGYAASKGGLLQLVRYLATTLAPRIRVNAVSPGGVRRGQAEVFQERYVARTPLARMATEEDIKGAVAFLASDLSAYVTGHNLVVDGGWTAW